MNVDPELDCANAAMAKNAMEKSDFVVALTQYENALLTSSANVLLPMSAFTETSGTYVNINGEWQSFKGVANPTGESRPAWKILRALGNFLDLDHFNYESSEEVKREAEATPSLRAQRSNPAIKVQDGKLSRIGEIPLYAIDSLVRHAEPLQIAQTNMLGDVNAARMHPSTAKHYQLSTNDRATFKQQNASATLSVILDERIAANAVWIAGGIDATRTMGDLFGEIEIVKEG
jgi:NADH-quinone oxidoreductase subunit G